MRCDAMPRLRKEKPTAQTSPPAPSTKGGRTRPEETACERFVSIRFGSVRLGSVRFGSSRFDSVRFGSVRFGSVRFGSVRFGSVRFGSVRFGSARSPTAGTGADPRSAKQRGEPYHCAAVPHTVRGKPKGERASTKADVAILPDRP